MTRTGKAPNYPNTGPALKDSRKQIDPKTRDFSTWATTKAENPLHFRQSGRFETSARCLAVVREPAIRGGTAWELADAQECGPIPWLPVELA
jgi:hypothetical protein